MMLGPSVFGLFANPAGSLRRAVAGPAGRLKAACGIATQGAGKIPFICFDLAGGANIAGSNVLVGKQGGQLDFLTTAGYSKLGLPGRHDADGGQSATGTSDFIDTEPGPRLSLATAPSCAAC